MPPYDGSELSRDQTEVQLPHLHEQDQTVPHGSDLPLHDRFKGQEQRAEAEMRHHRAVKANARMHELHGTEAQQRGGMTTKQRYGHEHFVEIGAKGGETVRDKRGKEFFVEIGRRGGNSPKRQSHAKQGSEDIDTKQEVETPSQKHQATSG
jgi:uncharacterized protein